MEDQPSGRDFGGQIRHFFGVVREQWWIILLCVLLTMFAAAAYTSTRDKEYEASAKLLVQSDNLNSAITGAAIGGVDPTRQAATDSQLASSPAVAERVRAQLRKQKASLGEAVVTTSANPDSNILTVTATDPDPAHAALVANAFAREYIAFRRDTTRDRYQRALRTIRTRLAETRPGTADRQALRAQAKQLGLLVSLQTGDAQLVQRAVKPAAAVRPKPARNIALAAIVGALLGLALAFLRDRLDRRVKSESELESVFPDLPLLALVPAPGRSRTSQLMTAEAYHTLQANLALLAREKAVKTLLVTSATPGEGKSTVALNLALAGTEKGESPLLLDVDLRRPSLTELVKADRRVGVSRILAGDGTVATSVQQRSVDPSRNGDGPTAALVGKLSIVPAGPPPANVQLLITEKSLRSLLDAAREGGQTAIFDGPPVGSFADMLPLAKEVDGVILVARLYHSRIDQLKRFATQLSNAGIKPLGLVVLGAAVGPSRYYAGYLDK